MVIGYPVIGVILWWYGPSGCVQFTKIKEEIQMACCPKSIIADILKAREDKGGIVNVYYVACGGSYAGLHPGKFFLQSEAKKVTVDHYTANEFCHATPKALGVNSIVITQSHSGTTPETVKAAEIAQKAGAASVVITFDDQSPLAKNGDYVLKYEAKATADMTGMAFGLKLAVEILNQIEGYENYDEMVNGFDRIDGIVKHSKEFLTPRAKVFAEQYKDEKLIYMMGSGANYCVAYSFAICLLMEMQWVNSSAIHSGEYFHGPFEITDRETPFIILMSEGRTRTLDERCLKFLNTYAENFITIDFAKINKGRIDPSVVEFFNPVVMIPVERYYVSQMAELRGHSMDDRRYMWKVEY